MVAISLQWHWGYRNLKLHHRVWSVSSGLILLDWIGDVIPLLTGRQSCKLGVTGSEEWSVPAGDSEEVFFHLQQKEAYMCPVTFIFIHRAFDKSITLSFFLLAEFCQFFMVVSLIWKDPWKPLPSLKVSELERERFDRLIFLFFWEWNQEGGTKEKVDEKIQVLNSENTLQNCYRN